MNKVTIGKPVDDFTAQATSDTTVTLSALAGTNVVLYFYPKDNTPGCISEGQAFTDYYSAFTQANTVVYGVSLDSLTSHEQFRSEQSYPFELISDPKGALCKMFDVLRRKEKDGEEYIGIERSTFLIDKDGLLQHEWRRVKIKDHVTDVLQATQALAC